MAQIRWNNTYITDTTNSDYGSGETEYGVDGANGSFHIRNTTMEDSSAEGLLQSPVTMFDPGLMQLQLHVRRLHQYYVPTAYTLTLLGNIFSIAVLTDNLLNKLSSTQYLIGILMVQIIHVLIQFQTWVEDNGWSAGMLTIGGWCQFTTFVTYVTVFLSVWYTVFLSIDSYVRASLPTLQRTLCKTWMARALIVGAAIIAIIVYLNISILYGTVIVGPRLVCLRLQIFKVTHDQLSCGDVFVNAVIPAVLLLIVMALITRHMCCDNSNTRRSRFNERLPLENNQTDNCRDHDSIVRSDSSQTSVSPGFILAFLIVHISFCAPLDAYHFVRVIEDFVSSGAPDPSLKGFLLEQIFQYIKSAKCVLNVIVLFGAHSLFRGACGRLPARIKLSLQACRRNKAREIPSDMEIKP